MCTVRCDRADLITGERAVPPECERREDYQLWRELGIRLGQKEFWQWENYEQTLDYRLRPMGYTHAEFTHKVRGFFFPNDKKKYEKYGFATRSGKVELYSSLLADEGYDPLPFYEEPAESPISTPELAREYPYILITGGRVRYFYHSEFRQIKSMRKRHPDPLVEINTETARKLGINNGDWVWIETHVGRIQQKAKLDPYINPRVVNCEHGWWFPEDPAEEPSLHGVWKSNVNVLLDDDPQKCDPIIGSWAYHGLCKIYRVA
jgi:anaerobic selenocysteine-containing dehydrogenase